MEDTKSNDRSASIINSQNSPRLLSACRPTGEVWRSWIAVSEVGNAYFDGDDGWHTTAWDYFEVKGGVGEPKRCHVKSVLMWRIQTGHVQYHSWGIDRRWKWGNATCAGYHQLRHNEHLYVTETAKTARSRVRTSIRHDSRPQWPVNRSHQQTSKNGLDGSVYCTRITTWRTGGAIRSHVGLRLGFGIA